MAINNLFNDKARIVDTITETVEDNGEITLSTTWTDWFGCYIAELSEKNALPSELKNAFNAFYVVLMPPTRTPNSGETVDLKFADGTSVGELEIESVTFGRKRNKNHNTRLLVKKVF